MRTPITTIDVNAEDIQIQDTILILNVHNPDGKIARFGVSIAARHDGNACTAILTSKGLTTDRNERIRGDFVWEWNETRKHFE